MKRWKKWLATVVAVVVAVVMGGMVNDTPISARAIIVGLGVDGDETQFEVTAQILLSSSSTVGQPEAKEVSAKADTVSGALSLIGKNSSMLVSLAHCNFVVLGGGVLQSNAFHPIDYLVRNAYLSENALLMGTEGSAKDILATKVAFSQLSSFYAQRTIENLSDYSTLAERSIKDFMVDQMERNKSNYLMLISKMPLEHVVTASSDTQGSAAAPGEEKQPEYTFDMTRTALFRDSVLSGVLEAAETEGLNLGIGKASDGAITIEGDRGETIELFIVEGGVSRAYEPSTRTLKLDVEVQARIKEINMPHGLEKRSDSRLTPTETERGNAQLAANIVACYDKAKAVGVDIFDVTGGLYRKYALQNVDVATTSLEVAVTLKVEG